jgi:hypothetical protein
MFASGEVDAGVIGAPICGVERVVCGRRTIVSIAHYV